MHDMLVRLYALPPRPADPAGCTIRVARPYERSRVLRFVTSRFSEGWADEAAAAFARSPVSLHIATREKKVVGFACYDATCRGFFGPTGVAEEARGAGLGTALLLASLHAMRDAGYGYAVIGGVGPAEFYARACGAIEIPGSTPGIYTDLLDIQQG